MKHSTNRLIDWFIPARLRETESDLLTARTFVILHLLGPLMGQCVTYFLSRTTAGMSWQFWVIEALVAAFLVTPFLLRLCGNLALPVFLSVQTLVGLSLFGSYYFGGISSPFLPWFLIALILGFFYLSDRIVPVLTGVAVQLGAFFIIRGLDGEFPALLNPETLGYANAVSIIAALCYMTLLALHYEKVMRMRMSIEQEMNDHRTQLVRLAEAMEAAKAASKRKSIFLAKMSHELRTPLNAVIGYTEMLRENCEDDESMAHKIEDLDRIHAAGRHLLALVNDVIDLSSIEANRLELSTEPIAIATLVEEVVATASPLIDKRGNKLFVDMPEDIGTIELDALKVRQSILNLLSNAAKFTTSGTIILRVLRKSSASIQRDMLHLEVADNGIGMSADALQRIFDDFGQAENDTASKFGGTGLGLALTRRFCQMMDGTISVQSDRGVGTSFTIEIPIIAPQGTGKDACSNLNRQSPSREAA
ncbi:MAG: hypothetical protein E2598_01430 [Sphingobium sp.]|nr:hypothetical protein [Sphingobium sp.]